MTKKSKKPKNLSSDIRGVSKLSIDAVKGTTKLVEALHSTISQYTPLLGTPKEKTKGLTSMVYKSINGITDLLGYGIDTLLSKSSYLHGDYSGDHKLSFRREAIASAMNGVLGDHFENNDNPLAITMSFRVGGRSLDIREINKLLANTESNATILIHGLCMNDLQWNREGHNHGECLSKDLNHTIIYLHYNTGLHVSENGKYLTRLLNELKVPTNVSLNFLTHSMGGLVAHSACFYAKQAKHDWLHSLNKMIFIGTPHHGALLAKGGHWADILLQISPYSAPFAKITKVRSNGLTDLRYGNVVDIDWQTDERQKVPLPEKISCFAIATTTSDKEESTLSNGVVGDGLVTINSALGKDKTFDLCIPKENQWIGRKINHMQMLSSKAIYQVINNWLED